MVYTKLSMWHTSWQSSVLFCDFFSGKKKNKQQPHPPKQNPIIIIVNQNQAKKENHRKGKNCYLEYQTNQPAVVKKCMDFLGDDCQF